MRLPFNSNIISVFVSIVLLSFVLMMVWYRFIWGLFTFVTLVFCLHQATGLVLLLWQMSAKREFFDWLLGCFSTFASTLLHFRLILVSSLPSYSSSQPPFIFFLAQSMQGSATGMSISPLCVSTIVNYRPSGRIGGMELAARTTAVIVISSAGACWSLVGVRRSLPSRLVGLVLFVVPGNLHCVENIAQGS